MGDVMQFPDTWRRFLYTYEFKDDKELYTNGANLILSFRVEQMIEHYFNNGNVVSVKNGVWEDVGYDDFRRCSICGYDNYDAWIFANYCPNCGAKMMIIEKDI